MWLCFVLKEDETREVKKILACYGKARRCDLRVVLLEIWLQTSVQQTEVSPAVAVIGEFESRELRVQGPLDDLMRTCLEIFKK